jgi:hypothetical protein
MEIGELEIALFLYGGNMENIKRPKQVSRAEKQVLSDKNAQQNAQEQFETIYDYLDALKDMIDIPKEPEEEPEEEPKGLTIESMEIVNHTLLSSSTVMPNTTIENTVEVEKEGYYPIGIAGWNASGTIFHISKASLGSATIYYKATNTNPNAVTCYASVRVMWVK